MCVCICCLFSSLEWLASGRERERDYIEPSEIHFSVDRLQIHFDDSHFVFRWLYLLALILHLLLLDFFFLSPFALLLEINHLDFYAFSPWAFSGFPFWIEFRPYFNSLFEHFLSLEKQNNNIRFITWMTSQSSNVFLFWDGVVFEWFAPSNVFYCPLFSFEKKKDFAACEILKRQ